MLNISVEYVFPNCFGMPSGRKKEGKQIEIDSISTVKELIAKIKSNEEYSTYYNPSFYFDGKVLRNEGKILEDLKLSSGSKISVRLSEPLQD